MTTQLAQKIRFIYEQVDGEFPDKSTEFVLEVTSERVRLQKILHNCDSSDVAEALTRTGRKTI